MTQQEVKNVADVKFHVAPDLEYHYRDMANIFVGAGDVVIEFGNYHRSMPGHVTVSNRIVMSIATAFEIQKQLQKALGEAQRQLQENLKAQRESTT